MGISNRTLKPSQVQKHARLKINNLLCYMNVTPGQ